MPSEPEEASADCDDLVGCTFNDVLASIAAKHDSQSVGQELGYQRSPYASVADPLISPKGLFTPGTKSGLVFQDGFSNVSGDTSSTFPRTTTKTRSEVVLSARTSYPIGTSIESHVLFTPGIDHHLPLVTPRPDTDDGTAEQADSSCMRTPQQLVANTVAYTPLNDTTDRTFDAFLAAFEGGHFTRTAEDCLSTGISQCVLRVSNENAELIRFSEATGLPIGFCNANGSIDAIENGRSLHTGWPDDYMHALRLLYRGEDLGIKENWITNHLRWIIWKLASMERRFAPYLAGQVLTYDNVLRQLSIRYEREIKQGLRPSLRKLVNRDASSTSMMILCVARIIRIQRTEDQTRQVKYGLELTDGWYSVRSDIDEALSAFIDQKRINVGTKLVISNAKLLGMLEGTDHLDAGFDVFDNDRSPHLEIRANACRIARWNAKLGFVSTFRQAASESGFLMTKRLRDVCVHGGSIPQIDVVVVESDPVKYLGRGNDGNSRVWSEYEESDRIEEMEKSRQKLVEQFRDEITKECEDVRCRDDLYMLFLTFAYLGG
jgi:BRCA2, oligonucleotide/oligosaccharide-binding, domain 1/BRCA2, helical